MTDVTKDDIYLEHRCATCNGQVIIIPAHGLFLQHEDADSEADHSVTQITERGTTWRPPATFHPPMKDSDRMPADNADSVKSTTDDAATALAFRTPRDVPEIEWRDISESLPLGAWIEPADDDQWVVNIPPRGLRDFDGDAIRAPYGDSYWADLTEAIQFVHKVAVDQAQFQTHMTDLCRIKSITVRSGSEIAEKYNNRTFITIPDRALVLEDSYYRQVYVLVGSDDDLQKLAGTILERINGDPLRQLLVDWFDAEMFQISETGSSADWQSVVDDAKARHEAFGIEWNDAFLPDYVREMLAINEED